jgi:hypothetical protein
MSTVENSVVVGVLSQRLIDAGELHVSRTSLGKNRTGNRYLIYLPLNRNYLWRLLHEKKVKVRVFIEVPSEVLNYESSKRQAEAGRQ